MSWDNGWFPSICVSLGQSSWFHAGSVGMFLHCYMAKNVTCRMHLRWLTVSSVGASNALSAACQNDVVYSLVKVVKLILLPQSAHSIWSRKEQQRRTVSLRKLRNPALFPQLETTWNPNENTSDNMMTRSAQTHHKSSFWVQYLGN